MSDCYEDFADQRTRIRLNKYFPIVYSKLKKPKPVVIPMWALRKTIENIKTYSGIYELELVEDSGECKMVVVKYPGKAKYKGEISIRFATYLEKLSDTELLCRGFANDGKVVIVVKYDSDTGLFPISLVGEFIAWFKEFIELPEGSHFYENPRLKEYTNVKEYEIIRGNPSSV